MPTKERRLREAAKKNPLSWVAEPKVKLADKRPATPPEPRPRTELVSGEIIHRTDKFIKD